jgi:transcriptional regulator with XRE-family HTH domain
MNERLRNAIAAAGLTVNAVAQDVGVDPKTVSRWITQDRIPHARHRRAAAALVRAEETYLWPALITEKVAQSAASAELITLYPHRGAVPGHLWMALAEAAQQAIDVLAYSSLFLWDGHPDLPALLVTKARAGTRIRIALGDPESQALRLRGEEEGIHDALSARVRMSLNYLSQAMKTAGVEVRLHGTTLYNSIYRFDDQLLVNTHTYGAPAAQSPVLHIRHLPGGRLFSHYHSSFERVWSEAQQANQPPVVRRSVISGNSIPN